MKIGRIVELSHRMKPGKENFKLEVKHFNVEEIMPQHKRLKDEWYILSEITMNSHVGTHIEFPYHHIKDGQDAAEFPVERLIGEALVLNFVGKKAKEPITLDELKAHEKKIKKGDILFIRTDLDQLFRTEQWENHPYITMEALRWLIEKGIRCMGSDAIGLEIETKGDEGQPVHKELFKNGIPFIESMTNLGALQKERFLLFILPLPIEGLDASPVRIIAIEE